MFIGFVLSHKIDIGAFEQVTRNVVASAILYGRRVSLLAFLMLPVPADSCLDCVGHRMHRHGGLAMRSSQL